MLIGIVAVVIFLVILILVHEIGHFLAAKKFGFLVEEFGIGLPPRIWGKKIGETVYSVNALPFGGFVKIFGENGERKTEERSFSSLAIGKRAIVISAGVLMNFLFGWLAISIVFNIGIPSAILITNVAPNSPAAEAGLLVGDKIVAAEADSVENFVKFINESKGKMVSFKIERAGKEIEIQAVPRIDAPANEGALGIGLVEGGLPKKNLLASVWEGFKTSIEMIKNIFIALFNLITRAFVGKAGLEQIAGPVGIVKITAQASNLGFIYLLQLLALISLNLAVINIFPFPALDGGRLLFLLIEKIKGAPLPVKIERYANAAGMALLLFLMIVITIKDIIRF